MGCADWIRQSSDWRSPLSPAVAPRPDRTRPSGQPTQSARPVPRSRLRRPAARGTSDRWPPRRRTRDLASGSFPPGPAVPRRPWTVTLAVCGHNGDGCGDRGHRPTVTLARATSPQAGTARPDGSIDPLMDATLVYVLHWTGMMCLPVGPSTTQPPPRGRSPPQPLRCAELRRREHRRRAVRGELPPGVSGCPSRGGGRVKQRAGQQVDR